MIENEGYIKFTADWQNEALPIESGIIDELNGIRTRLIQKGWLGVLPNGIGFGNISVRFGSANSFIITGSATGVLDLLLPMHFALVDKMDIPRNYLSCKGQTIASSESLTHAVLYELEKNIAAVVHIHSATLWQKYIDRLPTSDKDAAYGTPEMALSISTLFKQKNSTSGIFVMGGHQDGLIAFGQNLALIEELLLEL